jgi:uncharacterized membrane protein YdbT with pleckstrin-like domain
MAKSYLESLLAHNEKILRVARQHWFMLVRSIAFEAVLVVVVFAAVTALALIPGLQVLAPFGLLLALVPIGMLARDVLTWWNRQYVITSRRVIQIRGTLNKSVTDSSLEKVNDIKMVQSFFGRLFDFGDLEILTASEAGVDRLSWLEHPITFKTALLDAKEQMERD